MTARDPLIALAVHELRTPANVLGGYLQMLQLDQSPPLSERQRTLVEKAERACRQLVALFDELGEIQKLDANLVNFEQQPLDLFELVERASEDVRRSQEWTVALETSGPPTGASLRGDAVRLARAFGAILRAILRETPRAGRVLVERRFEDIDGIRRAVVVVADRRRRISLPPEAGRVPFDETRGGLGLALPIARRVFAHHGGRLWSPAGEDGRSVAVIALPILVDSR